MTLQELQSLAPDDLLAKVKETKPETMYDEGMKQYDPEQHDVKSTIHRPDKAKFVQTGKMDDAGLPEVKIEYVPVAKIALALQEYIISQRASFATGNKITFKADIPESPVFEAAQQTWRKSKMQYLLEEIAIRMMSETEVALIWYSQQDEKAPGKVKLRNRIVSPAKGDGLFPVFDKYRDMIAFIREYEVEEIAHYDLYTASELRRFRKGEKGYEEYFNTLTKDAEGNEQGIVDALPYGKIPVIYWSQPKPECDKVKDLIRAREFNQSDFFDNNQYYGDPMLFTKGEAINMPAKGVAGKILEGSADADAKFLTTGDTTASRKLEFDMLDENIFRLTRTAKLDAEALQGLGALPAAAMDRMLIDPHMAARSMQNGEFGLGIQRCMNFLLAVYSDILGIQDGVEAEPVFSLFRIDDMAEKIDVAQKANGGKPVMSQRASIEYAGTADYPDEMIDEIKAEQPEPAKETNPNNPLFSFTQ